MPPRRGNVAADFYLRQITWMECAMDVISEAAFDLLENARRDGRGPIRHRRDADVAPARPGAAAGVGEARRARPARAPAPRAFEHHPGCSTEPCEAAVVPHELTPDGQWRRYAARAPAKPASPPAAPGSTRSLPPSRPRNARPRKLCYPSSKRSRTMSTRRTWKPSRIPPNKPSSVRSTTRSGPLRRRSLAEASLLRHGLTPLFPLRRTCQLPRAGEVRARPFDGHVQLLKDEISSFRDRGRQRYVPCDRRLAETCSRSAAN